MIAQALKNSQAEVIGWFLVEDATKIIAQLDVCQVTGRIFGLIGSEDVYCPPTIEQLRQLLQSRLDHVAEYVIVSLLVPVFKSAPEGSRLIPPQFVATFNTNNKFDSTHVSARQSILIRALVDAQLPPVIGDGSDGDSRYMAMQLNEFEWKREQRLRIQSRIEHHTLIWAMDPDRAFFPFQDILHGLNKIINAFRDPEKAFRIGDSFVGLQDMVDIQELCSQSGWQHLVPWRRSDLRKFDPMNIPSSLRLISSASSSFITAQSGGTLGPSNPSTALIVFLDVVRAYVHAFASHAPGYSLLDRILDMAKAVCFFRFWRASFTALKLPADVVKVAFITKNAWLGIEMNFHSFINMVVWLNSTHQSAMVRPFVIGSQSAEKKFRRLRAYTPNGSTITNMSSLCITNRIKCTISDDLIGMQFHERHGKDGDLQNYPSNVRQSMICHRRLNYHRD